ncbi:MAG: AAA family ATPase [Cytophagales bacterium]
MRKLEIEKITIKGFKSIHSLIDFSPRQINVFIGQNGAGKSNFIGFIKFLSNMLSGTGNLSEYTAMNGGASVFLFDGPEVTPQIHGNISLKTAAGVNEYKFRLSHASSDTFVFTEEQFRYTANGRNQNQNWYDLGSGHKESALINAEATGRTQGTVKKLLQQLITYQFHNTTFNSPIRNNKSDIENNWFLEEDGRNLASVLYELRENQAAIYQKVISILQRIIPFFDDFVLLDQYGKTYLRWKEKNSSVTFVATQASDGMLRAMALVTLLCLPPQRLPSVMFLDEPELGLHPSAVKTICDLIQGVSEYCQVFIATQDADMLNEFMPEDIVVVTRNGRRSEFKQLSENELSEWIGLYSLSDLWHQNIIGGKP